MPSPSSDGREAEGKSSKVGDGRSRKATEMMGKEETGKGGREWGGHRRGTTANELFFFFLKRYDEMWKEEGTRKKA